MRTIVVILKTGEHIRFSAENWDGDCKWHWIKSGCGIIANFMNDGIVGIYEESFLAPSGEFEEPEEVDAKLQTKGMVDELWEKIREGIVTKKEGGEKK